ncbi:MAG: hypothetical protein E7A81_05270 [Clostridiales bacterium]|nr:hypothetical protein [Clostridiales bacterium]MDU1042644.1 hypothetical protein [Clostridiales bacterium]MDU3489981.1 hypothetical protein [Clostridiales bacterium]
MANNIDVDKIMSNIRQEIEDRGIQEPLASFDDISVDMGAARVLPNKFNQNTLYRGLTELAHNWRIESYREFTGSRYAVLAKKILRKGMYFFVNPLVDDQNKNNALFLKSLGHVDCFIRDQIEENRKLKARIKELEDKLNKSN